MTTPESRPDKASSSRGMNTGIAIGTGLGVIIGVLMGGGLALALGIAIGTGSGIAIGAAWDLSHQPNRVTPPNS
jgi:hypothetical protein